MVGFGKYGMAVQFTFEELANDDYLRIVRGQRDPVRAVVIAHPLMVVPFLLRRLRRLIGDLLVRAGEAMR